MPAKHATAPQLAVLLPLAISQGWSCRELAKRANIGVNTAMIALRDASKQIVTALKAQDGVDVLALTVSYNGQQRSLGEIQGKLVTGAVRSLARLEAEPGSWTESDDKTYRRCQTILRDARALGLIRFGEAKEGENPPGLRAVDPYLAQIEAAKPSKRGKSPENKASVNDVTERSTGEGAEG